MTSARSDSQQPFEIPLGRSGRQSIEWPMCGAVGPFRVLVRPARRMMSRSMTARQVAGTWPAAGRPWRNPREGGRKPPHRARPGTADAASPLGEGEEGCGLWSTAFKGACWGGGLVRKTPHRFPPGTAESASPPGEGEEWRPRRKVLDFGLAASPRQPPSPQPSPSREREKERLRLHG